MAGLLSLPDEVIEVVGKHVIGRLREGLKKWCQVTTTCTRLWEMQLPGSASEWWMSPDFDLSGKSKISSIQLGKGT